MVRSKNTWHVVIMPVDIRELLFSLLFLYISFRDDVSKESENVPAYYWLWLISSRTLIVIIIDKFTFFEDRFKIRRTNASPSFFFMYAEASEESELGVFFFKLGGRVLGVRNSCVRGRYRLRDLVWSCARDARFFFLFLYIFWRHTSPCRFIGGNEQHAKQKRNDNRGSNFKWEVKSLIACWAEVIRHWWHREPHNGLHN